MPRIQIVEFEPDSTAGEIVTAITGKKYSHTEMIIDGVIYGASTEERPWGYSSAPTESVERLKKDVRPHIIIKIDDKFIENELQIKRLKEWWDLRINSKVKYPFLRLLFFPVNIILQPLYIKYYERYGKVYKGLVNLLFPGGFTCAESCDASLKSIGIDLFKKLLENKTFPGMFADISEIINKKYWIKA